MNSFNNDDKYFIEICKKQIEKKLNWSSVETWKQRDYLDLIILIEKETGVNLSLSTVKRVWNENHHAIPQKSTLDALASFLGFCDWLEFKSSNGKSKAKDIKIPISNKSKKSISIILLASIVLAILAFATCKMVGTKEELNKEVKFSSKNTVLRNVPNTVIFNFDITSVEADSFFIQQSWNDFEKEKVDPKDSVFTTTYYYPGPHEAKIFADNRIIARTNLTIPTDDWIALLKKDNKDTVPTYLNINPSSEEGIMTIDPNQLVKNQISLNANSILSYYYIRDFHKLDQDNFRIKLRIKNDTLLNANCPKIHLGILGSSNPCFIPLTKPGCVGEIDLRIGNRLFKGKHTDLSSLGINIFEWQNIEFIKTNTEYSILLNDELVFSAQGEYTIGEIEGIMINFSGLGSVDYVKIDHPKTLVKSYSEEF